MQPPAGTPWARKLWSLQPPLHTPATARIPFPAPKALPDLQAITQYLDDCYGASMGALVRRCGLWKWNGFDKNDRNVMDGEGFDLTICYADGKQMEASGDNAFPDGYKAAENEINTYFKELLEQNGVLLTPERMG